MIKAVIFDADGMLINKPKLFSECLSEEFGIPLDSITSFFQKQWREIVIGKRDVKDGLKKYLEIWGWKGSVDDLLAYWFKSEDYKNEDLVEYIEFLKKKKVVCCLATNQEKYRLNYLRNEMGFGDLFDHIFASCQLGATKEQTVFWNKCLDILKYPLSDILVWDDEVENTEITRTLGLNAELYTNYDQFKLKMNEYLG